MLRVERDVSELERLRMRALSGGIAAASPEDAPESASFSVLHSFTLAETEQKKDRTGYRSDKPVWYSHVRLQAER